MIFFNFLKKFLPICFSAGKLMRIPNVQPMCSLIFSLTYIIHQSKPNSNSDIPTSPF